MTNRAVFLGRDGTIVKVVHYRSRAEDFELFRNMARPIKLLNEHNFKVIVVTNQSGIACGYFAEETLAQIHEKMKSELAKEGAWIDGIYYCPHHPDDNCDCRKPKPTMVLQAVKDFGINLKQSFVVGDLQMDIDMGKAVGCKTILVGEPLLMSNKGRPDYTASDLLKAVKIVLKLEGRR